MVASGIIPSDLCETDNPVHKLMMDKPLPVLINLLIRAKRVDSDVLDMLNENMIMTGSNVV